MFNKPSFNSKCSGCRKDLGKHYKLIFKFKVCFYCADDPVTVSRLRVFARPYTAQNDFESSEAIINYRIRGKRL